MAGGASQEGNVFAELVGEKSSFREEVRNASVYTGMDADSARAWLSGLHPCFACTLLSPTFPKSSLNFTISQLRALAILVNIPSTASFLRR